MKPNVPVASKSSSEYSASFLAKTLERANVQRPDDSLLEVGTHPASVMGNIPYLANNNANYRDAAGLELLSDLPAT